MAPRGGTEYQQAYLSKCTKTSPHYLALTAVSASSVPMPSAAAAATIHRSILNPIFNLT